MIKRKPTTPGQILKEDFLDPLEITPKQLADHIGCDEDVIHQLIKGLKPVSPKLALQLSSTFNISPDFWLNLQKAVDLYEIDQIRTQYPQSLPSPIC